MSRARLEVVSSLVAFCCAGCSSTIAVTRPLSERALAEVNDAIGGRSATVVLSGEADRDRLLQAERDRLQAERDRDLACQTGGSVVFGENCFSTTECECGLTCQAGRCLGTSLRMPKVGPPAAPEAKDVVVGPHTTSLLQLRPGSEDEWLRQSVPTAALRGITVVQRGRGAVEGIGLSALTGVVAGGLLGALVGSEGNLLIVAGTILGGTASGLLCGVLLGLPIGFARGHTTTIEFSDAGQVGGAVIVRPPVERLRYGPGQWLEKCGAPEDCGRGLTCVDRLCVKE